MTQSAVVSLRWETSVSVSIAFYHYLIRWFTPCLSLRGPIALRMRAKEDQEQQPQLCLLEG